VHEPKSSHGTLLVLSAISFCTVAFGADIAARIVMLDISFAQAIFEVAARPAGGWPALLFSALPFGGAFEVAKKIGAERGNRWAAIFLIGFSVILSAIYFEAYLAYQEAFRLRHWTDASLVVGFLVLKGFAVLLIPILIMRWRST